MASIFVQRESPVGDSRVGKVKNDGLLRESPTGDSRGAEGSIENFTKLSTTEIVEDAMQPLHLFFGVGDNFIDDFLQGLHLVHQPNGLTGHK